MVIMTIITKLAELQMPTVAVAEIKSHLSEYLSRSGHNRERFIITRRNRPVAALVSLDDLRQIEQLEERQGLAEIASSWSGFEEIADTLDDLEGIRQLGGGGRDVSL